MLAGKFELGQISMVVKTDIEHPNPAVRDFVAMRMVDEPHPLTGSEYSVYPLYNFSVAVDAKARQGKSMITAATTTTMKDLTFTGIITPEPFSIGFDNKHYARPRRGQGPT
jgi:hypothetical protein